MANEINNAEKLIERILADAREDAEKAGAAAAAEVERLKKAAEHDIWQIKAEGGTRSDALRESILERSRTNAELDSRKYALSARREVIDAAFKEAAVRLLALSGQQRDELLLATAVREADGGETVLPSATDAEAMGRLLPEINARLKEAGKAGLTLGGTCGAEGGFVLSGSGYEKNCSFAAMLHEVREREESRVSKILFNK